MTFSLLQLLSVLGMVQSLLIIVYIVFRSGSFKLSFLSLLFFMGLFIAFVSDFSAPILQEAGHWPFIISTILWGFVVPLSSLVMLQVLSMGQIPESRHFIPLMGYCFALPFFWSNPAHLNLSSVIFGASALLGVWSQRRSIAQMYDSKFSGKERYWLCMSLFVISAALLAFMLAPFGGFMARSVLGLAFVYLAGTVLFRIYPQSIPLHEPRFFTTSELSKAEEMIADKIKNLLDIDKVYQEPSYGRKNLAQECDLAEAQISRIINIKFRKTLPQLLNDYRTEVAKKMLLETKDPVKTISEIVGFNSLASFNRVFKDLTGCSPSEFRVRKSDENSLDKQKISST